MSGDYDPIETAEFWPRFKWIRSASGYIISNTASVVNNSEINTLVDRAQIYRDSPDYAVPPFIIQRIPNEEPITLPQKFLFPHPNMKMLDKQTLPALALAQSAPGIEAMLSFANQFGLLTGGLLLAINSDPYWGDSLKLWFEERWVLKNLLQLWAWISKRDITRLKTIYHPYSDNIFRIVMSDEAVLSEIRSTNGLSLKRPTEIQLQVAAENYITRDTLFFDPFFAQCDSLSDELVLTNASLFLEHVLRGRLERYPSRFDVAYNPCAKRLEQQFRPFTLIGLIWYQFSHYVTGERRIKQCDHCHQWQDVTGKYDSWKWHKTCGGIARRKRSRSSTGKPRGRPKKIVSTPQPQDGG